MTWTTQQRSNFGPLPAIHAGEGPLVLLLHGVGLRAEAWSAQINALSHAGFRVIAPDMIGHATPRQTDACLPSDLDGFVAPLLETLSGPTVVIGHSMGAMMALRMAQKRPEIICGVGALNAIFQRSSAAKSAVRRRAQTLSSVNEVSTRDTLMRWFKDENNHERAACQTWLKAVDPQAYKAAYCVFAAEDGPSAKFLAQLPCPALFLTGAQEPNSTPEMSVEMAKLAPNGRAKIVPGAAHMLPMTHPEIVSAMLIEFVTECFDVPD